MAAEVDGGSAQHMWSLSIHLVTEHPHGSLSVHVCHCRLDRAHGGGTLRLIQRSLGAGGQIRLCILASCDCDGAATGRVGGR